MNVVMEQEVERKHSLYVKVKGSRMHYLESGQGNPIVFIHGMPTSSFLWRNIIPEMERFSRCIALDLIGMGKSDKPEIEYTIFDHIAYVEQFIEQMNLKNIVLMMHGWGSVIGFSYAYRNPHRIKGLAFYEAHISPDMNREMLSLPVQQLMTLLNRPGAAYRAIIKNNYLLDKLLPSCSIVPLKSEIMAEYRRPFLTQESRKPLWQYIKDLPLGNGPSAVVNLIQEYVVWLEKIKIPKLLIYAVPGFMTPIVTVEWAKKSLLNLDIVALEDALHLAQESMPKKFSQILANWYKKHFL